MKKFKVKAILRQSLRNQKALSKTYSERIEVFSKWAESKGYKRGTMDDVNRLIPEYLREREDKGLSAATLHTDLAALCKAVERPMSDFKTYYRGQPTKGRDDTVKRVRTDRNERVVHLAERIGIRKSEYEHLHKNDFKEKEGQFFVVVRSGKGGKYQEQLVPEKYVEDVRQYFDGTEERVFTSDEIKACWHANLHELRRELAQKMYDEYKELLKNTEEREKMKNKLEEVFNYNPQKYGRFQREKMDIPYRTRGAVRRELEEFDRPTEYDRLALMAVSVFHLAHYREDVTVKNYMK